MENMYRIFGLDIFSVIPLPSRSVVPARQDGTPDVIISYGETPAALTNPRKKGVRYQAAPGEFLLRVDNVAHYYVQHGSRITVMPEAGADDDDILLFLMGSVMGALLHQRNVLVLHAGAIAVNGESAVFCGPSAVGKSTLVAGFLRRGYPFLADDVCAITSGDGRPAVIPGFPRVKVWADVLTKLNTRNDTLKSIRRGMGKYFLPIDCIQESPVPIRSVFVLETTSTGRMEITALRGADKVGPLIDNTYRLPFLRGLGKGKDHFTQCAAVAAGTDVFLTVRSRTTFLLDELLDMVEAKLLS